jgi:hypothetical protein
MLAGMLLLSFSSCLKDNNNYIPPNQQSVGGLSIIQASPDEPPITFFLNNDIVNNAALQFGDYINYVPAYSGTRTANFDNASTMAQIYSTSIIINQNQYYSLFLTNTTTTPKSLFLTDTLNQPASGKAGIRFINLSPNAPAVDFLIENTTTSTTNESFMGYSSFLPVAGGSYTIQVNQTGTTNTLATLANVNLRNGGLYTIWLQGLNGSTSPGDKLGINIMNNAQF